MKSVIISVVFTIFLCSSQALYIVDREVGNEKIWLIIKKLAQKKSHEITNFKIIYIIFSAYLERAIDSAIEAFQVYDKSPTDGKLSYEELLPVSNIYLFWIMH